MRLLLIILLFIGCTTQNNRRIRINEIGWTFEIPATMNFKDSAFDRVGNIDKSFWDSSFDRQRLQLFNIQPKGDNYFNCILFKDTSDYSTWEKATLTNSRFIFKEVLNQQNYKILDTTLSIYKIGSVNFHKEYFRYYNTKTKDTVCDYHFSRLHKDYDININVHYTDHEWGEQYLQIIKKSKFDD